MWEKTSSYIANGHQNLNIWNNSYAETTPNNNVEQISTKYATVYKYNETTDNGINNRAINGNVYGDSTIEISSGEKTNGWQRDYSGFPYDSGPLVYRGAYWKDTILSGIFAFGRYDGSPNYSHGGRAVVVEL